MTVKISFSLRMLNVARISTNLNNVCVCFCSTTPINLEIVGIGPMGIKISNLFS